MAETLVREPRRREEFQTFYLAEVSPLAEGKEIQQLRNIIAPGKREVLAWSR